MPRLPELLFMFFYPMSGTMLAPGMSVIRKVSGYGNLYNSYKELSAILRPKCSVTFLLVRTSTSSQETIVDDQETVHHVDSF